jgi:hypothetical protein
MTTEEAKQRAIDRLNLLKCSEDHQEAEEILLELLESLGAGKVVTTFLETKERIEFWYA